MGATQSAEGVIRPLSRAVATASADRVRTFLERLPATPTHGALRRAEDGSVAGNWYGCELSSVFQPVVDPRDGRVTGHEAFLRCRSHDGRAELSPWNLFAANADDDRLIALDRLARTLHTLNFLAAGAGDGDGLLFLNVHGRLLAGVTSDHGFAFRRVVDALGFDPARIVIETPRTALDHVDLLAFVHRNYRQNGFRVAANVEDPAQWQALSPMVPAQFLKIDGARLLDRPDPAGTLAALDAVRGSARVIVTRLEHRPGFALPDGTLVQGHAWGVPSARLAPAA